MQSIGLQRLAVILNYNAITTPRPPPVESHGEQHHCEGCKRWLDLDSPEEQADDGFVYNPRTCQQEQCGLNASGEVFDLAVTILVIGISRFVGNTDGEK